MDDSLTKHGAAADRRPTWEDAFVAIVQNKAKSATPTSGAASGPQRERGFIVITHGSESLQGVQAVCHGPGMRGITCLTARYRVRSPVLGNLLAALVKDLARLAEGHGAGALTGVLLPPTSDMSKPPWATLRSNPFGSLAEQAGLEQPAGELSAPWVTDLFGALGDSRLLPSGVRLVVFAEVVGPTEPENWDELVATPLPERFGIVLSGVSVPVAIAPIDWWRGDAVGRTGSVMELPVEKTAGLPAFHYLDAPLSADAPAEVDALGLRRYARGLAKLVLLRGTGPLTIGVHAPWGGGKTSFMRFIDWELARNAASSKSRQKQLDALAIAERAVADPTEPEGDREKARHTRDSILEELRHRARRDVIPVWFNAWRYDGATQIWAGLTHEITERMEQTLPRHRRLTTRVAYAVRKQGAAFWVTVVLPTIAAVLLSSLAFGLGLQARASDLGDQLPDWLGWLVTIAPTTWAVALGGYLAWRFSRVLTPVSERLLDYVRQQDYREHMGYQEQVRRDIEFLMRHLGTRRHRPRVVVFIDDLDRCSDDKVLDTLQAINLLLTASGCYVFLGVDTDMIARAIARKYGLDQEGRDKEDRDRAESYLRKIIQLSFRLPAPERDQRLTLITQFFSEQAQREYASLAGRPGASSRPVPGPTTPGGAPPRRGYAWRSQGADRPAVFEVTEVEDTGEELDAFARLRDVVPKNPRELKRLANLHRLVKLLVQHAEAPPTTAGAQRLLVTWLVFCYLDADAAQQLLNTARKAPKETAEAAVPSPELDALIELLNKGLPAERACGFTWGDLAPGSPLAEVATISARFKEEPGESIRSGGSAAAGGR